MSMLRRLSELQAVCALVSAMLAVTAFAFGRPPTVLSQVPATRTAVVTFDDLPYVGVGTTDYVGDAGRVAGKIIDVLRAHDAPAVAFVNEGKLDAGGERDARTAVLQRWVDAGVVLGNHTYSHQDLNDVTIDRFKDEIVRGEPVSRQLMARRGPYRLFFRHPETHTGETPEKKAAIDAFLAERGYTIAPHTVENSDYIFDVPYGRAVRSADAGLARRLADAYFQFTLDALAFAEAVTPKIFGRDIPQTLLLHANGITADNLDRILSALEKRGYRFVALDDAMGDPAYQTPDTLVSRFGPTWLWRWTKSKGLNVSFAADPEVPSWVVELYNRR